MRADPSLNASFGPSYRRGEAGPAPTIRLPEVEESRRQGFSETAERIRQWEQNLKDNLDFYLPLEDILGVPVIGVDANEFLKSVWGWEGLMVNIEQAETEARLLVLGIYPDHIRRKTGGACLPMYGVPVGIRLLPDNTLRPLMICDYNRLSATYDIHSLADNLKYSQIDLIGRNADPNRPADHLPTMRFAEYEFREEDIHYRRQRLKSHRVRFYDTDGSCILDKAKNHSAEPSAPEAV